MKLLIPAIISVLVLFSSAFAQPATQPAHKPEPVRTLAIGESAPDFDLPGVDGKRYTLKNFADAKLLLIVFTCNHCPTAQAYEERIKKIAKDYQPKGVSVVAISPNDPQAVRLDELGYTDLSDSFAEMKIRAKHKDFNFPYLYDGETQKISRKYGPAATPTAYLFDAHRKLRYVGRVDDAEREQEVKTHDLKDALDALLAGKPVPVEKTKTFGCSIKWADKRDSVVEAMKKLAAEPVSLENVDADGLKKLLTGKSDKLRLVNFWATWCGECVTEIPDLVTMNRMYRLREFELVTVSADHADKKDAALAFLKKQQVSSRNFQFTGRPYDLIELVDKDWDGNLPYTVLIDKDGKPVYHQAGRIDPLELRREIVKSLGTR